MISRTVARVRIAMLVTTGSLMLTQLTGCATPCWSGCSANFGAALPPAVALAVPTKFSASGYGSSASYAQYTPGQQKLMAMRAARLDAYRNLAEQIYGFRISGNTSISAFATQNDSMRSYLDAYLRGARVTNTASLSDGNFEVTVELDITPDFRECFGGGDSCLSRYSAGFVGTCGSYGCPETYVGYSR